MSMSHESRVNKFEEI